MPVASTLRDLHRSPLPGGFPPALGLLLAATMSLLAGFIVAFALPEMMREAVLLVLVCVAVTLLAGLTAGTLALRTLLREKDALQARLDAEASINTQLRAALDIARRGPDAQTACADPRHAAPQP